MLPPRIFASRQFTAANVVTFVVYAALSGVFFFLVVDLQVVAGFSPLLAGSALLPVTLIMLVLSARAGAMADRIGPRLPMTLGPIVAACGLLLLLRVGPNASYLTDVLPGVTVFGLGLALIVAPLTTTVLAAAESGHAGIASGVNNAVARAAGLLAVAVLPLIAGISGDDYQHPEAFAAGHSFPLAHRWSQFLPRLRRLPNRVRSQSTWRQQRSPRCVLEPRFRRCFFAQSAMVRPMKFPSPLRHRTTWSDNVHGRWEFASRCCDRRAGSRVSSASLAT